MNKVYFFSDKHGQGGGIHIAASTWKAARNFALHNEITEFMDEPFIDLKGSTCRKGSAPITTELEGVLTVQQTVDLGLAWWNCEQCGDDDFEIFPGEQEYKCRVCGALDGIPYVDF
jgi:hypothetical protein